MPGHRLPSTVCRPCPGPPTCRSPSPRWRSGRRGCLRYPRSNRPTPHSPTPTSTAVSCAPSWNSSVMHPQISFRARGQTVGGECGLAGRAGMTARPGRDERAACPRRRCVRHCRRSGPAARTRRRPGTSSTSPTTGREAVAPVSEETSSGDGPARRARRDAAEHEHDGRLPHSGRRVPVAYTRGPPRPAQGVVAVAGPRRGGSAGLGARCVVFLQPVQA